MDVKDIKLTLKYAKESLNNKDYKSAIKHCKNILKLDKNHYMALVLYAAAVQETDQKNDAVRAFKKAIDITPDHILAWRGLACHYEKNSESSDIKEKINVYEKLVALESDLNKVQEAIAKLKNLCGSDFGPENVKAMQDLLPNVDDQKKILIHQYLIYILDINLLEECKSVYESSLQYLLSLEAPLYNHFDLLQKYMEYLYKHNNLEMVLQVADSNLDSILDNTKLLRYICKAYTELPEVKLKEISLTFSPEKIYIRLLESDPKSFVGNFCKGLYEFHTQNFVVANDTLKNAAKLNPNSGLIWFYLSKCQLVLYQFDEAEESVLKSIEDFKKSDNNVMIHLCEKILLKALCEQNTEEKLLEAVELGLKLYELNSSSNEILESLIKALVKLKKFSDATNYIDIMSESVEYKTFAKYMNCMILKEKNEIENCISLLKELTLEAPDYFDAWFDLGKIMYYQNDTACFTCFLKSARLNEWCYLVYLYLGHCYSKIIKELKKAQICYEKAYQLNFRDPEVGKHLSDTYRLLGLEELNFKLLTFITSTGPRSKWAWLKLGLHHLATKNYHKAVSALQTAVRWIPKDWLAWECLGDAYFAQGAFSSSIKSYQKSLEFHPESTYALFQIAKIKHLSGLLNQSLDEFRVINEKVLNYIPALKGHAEVCLSIMKKNLSQNLNGLAQNYCQEAVIQIAKCLNQKKDLNCVWKLLGDCCTWLLSLPKKYCYLKIPSWLYKGAKGTDEEMIIEKYQIFKLGARCFCQAIVNNSHFSSLWYDLAFIYNKMAQIAEADKIKRQMRMFACAAIKKSILLNKDRWQNWNLYGIILASEEIKDYYLAQHCFIKSIKLYDTNAITWTNLGALYLILNDLPIANQSFTEAQKYDHNYPLCWVGQAIIAHRTNHPDAMDLFRHSTQLGFTEEGCLGYSLWVCQVLLGSTNTNQEGFIDRVRNSAVAATDLLTWYTDRYENNAWAFNMLGLLLERQKLYGRAEKAFRSALNIIKSKTDVGEIFDQVLLNHSRVLSRLDRYDEALSHLKQIKKATFTNQCELAATYFRAKLYEDAYSSYGTILEWLAPDAELKSHVLVAMAAVVYLFQGQEDAKLLLMQACQLKPASVHGLFACCALGMLHSDLELSELALKELRPYKSEVRYLKHIAIFQSYFFLFKGDKQKARRVLCDSIHRYPGEPSHWLGLSIFLLNLHISFGGKVAAKCANAALSLGKSSLDMSKVVFLISLGNLLSENDLKSFKSSQKAVHLFPNVDENWIVLLASALSISHQNPMSRHLSWMKKIVGFIMKKYNGSIPMNQWLTKCNQKISNAAEKLDCGFPEIEIEASYFGLENYPLQM